MNKTSDEKTCCICFDPCENTLRCSHPVHEKCIEKWSKYNSCPVCRNPIDETKTVKKFTKYDNDTEDDEEYALSLYRQSIRENFNPFQGLFTCVCGDCGNPDQLATFYVSCANCGTDIGMGLTSRVRSCSRCNQWFYCSNECEQAHDHGC